MHTQSRHIYIYIHKYVYVFIYLFHGPKSRKTYDSTHKNKFKKYRTIVEIQIITVHTINYRIFWGRIHKLTTEQLGKKKKKIMYTYT